MQDEGPDKVEIEDDGPANPFDNPYFLPVLLTGFSLWFLRDGFFHPDPAYEHVTFNRWAALPAVLWAAWAWFRSIQEIRATRAARAGNAVESNKSGD